jgi:hypothetical protein
MNWLFFSAMVEAALRVMGESDYDLTRVDYAVNMFESWYLGDGVYGDGPKFRWDYYNSFVIQPMYVDVLRTFADVGRGYDELLKQVEHRGTVCGGAGEKHQRRRQLPGHRAVDYLPLRRVPAAVAGSAGRFPAE